MLLNTTACEERFQVPSPIGTVHALTARTKSSASSLQPLFSKPQNVAQLFII
jgi:hypothetical protein